MQTRLPFSRKIRIITRVVAGTFIVFIFLALYGVVYLIEQDAEQIDRELTLQPVVRHEFPVGVHPETKEVVENPAVDAYFNEHILATGKAQVRQAGVMNRIADKLALFEWYQNLASVSDRTLVIRAGERSEEVASHFAKILGWNTAERTAFLAYVRDTVPAIAEGKFFPGRYSASRNSTPEEVGTMILEKFNEEVLSRYSSTTESSVPLRDALIIASLLEREAYDFTDMREISGVIWNRLFIGMNLQIDATLQYAKGSDPREPWWPRVRPEDKFIESSYNTYKNAGLPPTSIANPSLEAILAALNPRKTDCLFYFHDKDAGFHCSPTYEGHVALLKHYYGRGK